VGVSHIFRGAGEIKLCGNIFLTITARKKLTLPGSNIPIPTNAKAAYRYTLQHMAFVAGCEAG
jgi:hypothetical protein